MDERIKIAEELAKKSGLLLSKIFSSQADINYQTKPDNSFVTENDKEVEKIIVEGLQKYFPDDGFIGEEGSSIQSKTPYSWVIDPIDGSTNFIYRLPFYSVSIGILNNDFLEGGVMYLPSLDRLYSVKKGSGFFYDLQKFSPTTTKKLDDAMVIFSVPHKGDLKRYNKQIYPIVLDSVKKLRILGSVSVELAMVASGQVDVVVAVGMSFWDVAAGVLMVRESGGKVVDFQGQEWTSESKTLIAGNTDLVEQLVLKLKGVSI